MGNESLMARVGGNGNGAMKARDPATEVREMLARMRGDIMSALPSTAKLTPERLARIAVTTLRTTPALMNCTVPSLIGAMVQCAQLGLEPDPRLGLAYLVPYGKECQLIIGYRGLMQLARRSGEVVSIEAHVVHEFDRFECVYGTDAHLRHEPVIIGDRGEMVAVYAVAKLRDGGAMWDVMSKADVDVIKARSRGKGGPWGTDYLEMARKTVVRRLAKYLPLSVEWADAESVDGAIIQGVEKDGPVLVPAQIIDPPPPSVDEPGPDDLPEPSFGGEP